MKKSSSQPSLTKKVLYGAVIYLILFFALFFFTNLIGTKLNWLFWLLPPFYALYISQLTLSEKLLKQLIVQRLSIVFVLSFVGTYFAYVSFPFIVLLFLEVLLTLGKSAKQKKMPLSAWSLILLVIPLLYFISTRMYYAGLLNWITTAITFVALVLYWFLKRSGLFKRLFVPK